MKYNYKWTLKDATFTKDKGTVFSCFACGGGSTMGYKLAGFDVIGCNEIDPKMMECYRINHHPKYSYLEPIQEFKLRDDLPDELYNLDILDGSPPCSSFSMAGNREKDWGKDKKFKEGQAEQVLDTLFFDFIELAEKLKPKIVIAENVKGLLMGEAREYLSKILTEFEKAGYKVTYKLLNAAKMGVPQRRERVFFLAVRNDLADKLQYEDMFAIEPYIDLEFNEGKIPYKDVRDNEGDNEAIGLTESIKKYWLMCDPGESFSTVHPKGSYFNEIKLHPNKVVPTIRASGLPYDYKEERVLFKEEICKVGTYPIDYSFIEVKPNYLIGMSVPPVMTAQIATRVYEQWLNKIKDIHRLKYEESL